jgi:isopentenyl phosphate kinase
MTTVLKLGGSVVTEKGEPETVDSAALDAAAAAVADAAGEETVLVHGGGSFGHPAAERHGVGVERGSRDPAAAREIHAAMKRLNGAVIDALADAGAPALPVHPLSAASRDGAGELDLPVGAVERMLGEGFLPVLHGDVVSHAGEGVTVLSGDELVVSLVEGLGAERAGLCSTVPGVLDADGEVIPEIRTFEEVSDALGGSEDTDVTGGMAGKVRTLLALDAPATVFGPEALSAFLAGEAVGTRVGGPER